MFDILFYVLITRTIFENFLWNSPCVEEPVLTFQHPIAFLAPLINPEFMILHTAIYFCENPDHDAVKVKSVQVDIKSNKWLLCEDEVEEGEL